MFLLGNTAQLPQYKVPVVDSSFLNWCFQKPILSFSAFVVLISCLSRCWIFDSGNERVKYSLPYTSTCTFLLEK
ncbi:hypothetical protein ISN44_As13g002730 [Arabidopsis suecica]|uniref:Uncharacterized protein n=1 Tax=Arabidopsis suecica TaxID=45249 RepID=A0A8T1XPM4_ARASU|nr:hypothetical protein ISN44_As13g002730 [Arabidopsis suecica]